MGKYIETRLAAKEDDQPLPIQITKGFGRESGQARGLLLSSTSLVCRDVEGQGFLETPRGVPTVQLEKRCCWTPPRGWVQGGGGVSRRLEPACTPKIGQKAQIQQGVAIFKLQSCKFGSEIPKKPLINCPFWTFLAPFPKKFLVQPGFGRMG